MSIMTEQLADRVLLSCEVLWCFLSAALHLGLEKGCISHAGDLTNNLCGLSSHRYITVAVN
eukprot:SAG31_NODE_13260_length_881_cov_13.125320_1_plen_61_part_00